MKYDSSFKILEWEKPESIRLAAELCRNHGDRIVLTTGVFDLKHEGHVSYLEKAAGYASVLFVAVDSDARVKRGAKGEKRPIHRQTTRLINIASMGCVDRVFVFEDQTAAIRLVVPNVVVVSSTSIDYPDFKNLDPARELGAEIVVLEAQSSVHTSDIIADIVAKYGNGA